MDVSVPDSAVLLLVVEIIVVAEVTLVVEIVGLSMIVLVIGVKDVELIVVGSVLFKVTVKKLWTKELVR